MNNSSENVFARTENGALTYSTSKKELVDQFSHAGTSMGRPIDTVFSEQDRLWNENPDDALRFPFYLRLITRKIKVSEKEKTGNVQRGAGLRDEAFKRILWIAYNHESSFKRNAWVLPVVGSWKDLWTLMVLDMENENRLDKTFIFSVMASGLDDKCQCDLIRKYMPAIKSNIRCKTDRAKRLNRLAKAFAAFLGLSHKEYRQMKTSGNAHDFQKIICSRAYADIDWKTIPGRALSQLISGNFLGNHGLTENYLNWVMAQPTVKFTGYVYELGRKLNSLGNNVSMLNAPSKAASLYTINKQFDGLIELARQDEGGLNGNVLCAIDTSGSMTCPIHGQNNLTSYDVCVSLGIYFSELNEGYFHDIIAMFDSTSSIMKLNGTFAEKWNAIKSARTAWGSTNVLSIIRMLLDLRKTHPEIPIKDYCNTILVISDMQFDPTGMERNGRELTTYEAIKSMLRTEFPDEWVDNLKIVWWYCASREGAGHDVPATIDDPGMYLVSGFDGSIVNLLLRTKVDEKTGKTRSLSMEESVQEALSQEIFSFVRSN